MIYIWDNGLGYSDHRIWFVESDLPADVVSVLMESDRTDGAKVIAVVERVEWRKGKPATMAEWVSSHCGLNLYSAHREGCDGAYGEPLECTCASGKLAVELGLWK